jgi:hypothetical protein
MRLFAFPLHLCQPSRLLGRRGLGALTTETFFLLTALSQLAGLKEKYAGMGCE